MKYVLFTFLICLSACAPVHYYEQSDKLTTGIVQREIHIGMPASDVVTILGSPNIVSLDENKDEVWVYGKVSCQVERCANSSGIWLLIVGQGSSSCYTRKTQRTLTVIVKFDQDKQVKDFTYHSSSF